MEKAPGWEARNVKRLKRWRNCSLESIPELCNCGVAVDDTDILEVPARASSRMAIPLSRTRLDKEKTKLFVVFSLKTQPHERNFV